VSLDEAFDSVQELVQSFDSYKAVYMKPDYSEPQARLDFIDKYFIALGWDVNHETQTNPYKQEVKVEKNVDTGHSQRRADYAFYVAPNYQDVKYYVEAKKPSVDIESKDSYFQIIRYGWNSQTPIGVLTDFEQFHIVDCRYRPSIKTALDRGLKKYCYTDYLNKDKFAEIYYLFSREAVGKNSIEDYTATLPKRKGRGVQKGFFRTGFQNIDDSFLLDLDSYRKTLAEIFKKTDNSLDGLSLTEMTQRTLDRLVFLRFLEDKLIETHYRIANFGDSGSSWRDFIATSRKLDDIYNGIIFKKHPLLDSPDFNVDNNDFSKICEELSHTYTPYDFNHIPIHILGSIYERFLGKVIVSTAKRATVKEKPEVRKAGGVYYTPEYIVRYIVEHTIGKLIKGKTPPEIAKMRFIDIACGSGSFLLGMYQYLLDYHRQWYNDNPKKAKKSDCFKHEDGTLHLKLEKKRDILLNNIYGVDIDFQAVEVSQLSLYLKMLEEETTESAHQYLLSFEHERRRKQLLPSLDGNVKGGNSLIGMDFYEGSQGDLFNKEDRLRINAFDWGTEFDKTMNNGGFDAVIGNPPYVRIQNLKEWAPKEVEFYKKYYKSANKGNYDIYVVMVERGLQLLNQSGRLGFILPHKFFNAKYGELLRALIAKGNHLGEVVHFGDQQIFKGATTYACLMFLDNAGNKKFRVSMVSDLAEWQNSRKAEHGDVAAKNINSNEWNFVVGKSSKLFEKLTEMPTKLGDVSDIFVGLQTSADDVYIMNYVSEDSKHIILDSKSINSDWTFEKDLLFPIVSGQDVHRYQDLPSRQYILFPYEIDGDVVKLIDFKSIEMNFPKTASYFVKNQKKLKGREKKKPRAF